MERRARWWLRPRVAVLVATVAFAEVFGWLAVGRLEKLGFGAFDLGIFDQGLWLLSRGETPFVTLRGLHLFGDHASWIMLLLVPLYWVWSDVRALVLLTVLALAAPAPLLYGIGRKEGLTEGSAAALAVAYLLHPVAAWNTWDNFHPEVLAVPLLVGAYRACLSGRWGAAVGLLAGVLAVKEDAFLVVAPFALYMGWRWAASRRWAAFTVLLSVAVALLNFGILLPHFSPTGGLIRSDRYPVFAGDWAGTADLLFRWSTPGYVVGLLLPAVLAVREWPLVLAAVPVTVANLMTWQVYQRQINWHYSVYALALLSLAAVRGAVRLTEARPLRLGVGRRGETPARSVSVWAAVVLVAGGLGQIFGPWNVTQNFDPWGGTRPAPGILDVIPAEAGVATHYSFATELAHRRHAYLLPFPHAAPDYWGAGGGPALPPPDVVGWVVLRPWAVGDSPAVEALAAELADPARWRLRVDTPDVAVYERIGPPAADPGPPVLDGRDG